MDESSGYYAKSQISQSQKTNIIGFYLYEVLRVVKCIETENRMVAVKGWGEGKMENECLMGAEFNWGR